MVNLVIDDVEMSVPKGTLVIRAAELLGVQIPRFCDHPLLDPVGACRQCLVEVEGQRKPMASCTITVTEGMVVRTQYTSESADKAQHGVMELLLINHPLDCPVCDKGGECPLQNQAMSNGRVETRFTDIKRTFPKPINLSSQVLLDRERCVLCARCTRFSEQIAGDPFISLLERGALQQVGIAPGEAFDSYFSGNTVQICPVGALTGTAYRFRARPFDLVSSPSVCEHCASGCAQRTDHRRGVVLRRLAGDDPEVNEEWNCDKGRWAFTYARVGDRITTPLVRDDDGALRPASWSEAIAVAAAGLTTGSDRCAGRRPGHRRGRLRLLEVHPNGAGLQRHRLPLPAALGGGGAVPGRPGRRSASTSRYADLETAPVVVLVGFEPEEESPIVFLRLRKAARKRGLKVVSIAPFASLGFRQVGRSGDPHRAGGRGRRPRRPRRGAARRNPARSSWSVSGWPPVPVRCPRRPDWPIAPVPGWPGSRGGPATAARWTPAACPTCCPAAARSRMPTARQQLTAAWHIDELPAEAGRDTTEILAAAADGDLDALLVGGVDPADLPDPHTALAAIEAAGFVVSLELRESAVTALADVVFPIAPVVEKAGSFINWEGRYRPFEPALTSNAVLRPSGTADAGRRPRRRPRVPHRRAGPRRDRGTGTLGRAARRRPRGTPRTSGTVARQARSGAGRLANAVGPRPITGRRTVPGGHRPAPGGPAVGGDRRRDRRGRR